jgi:hypothetical protein
LHALSSTPTFKLVRLVLCIGISRCSANCRGAAGAWALQWGESGLPPGSWTRQPLHSTVQLRQKHSISKFGLKA